MSIARDLIGTTPGGLMALVILGLTVAARSGDSALYKRAHTSRADETRAVSRKL